MARVGAEAVEGDKREWSLVCKHAGWQRRLRTSGFFAGHDTKEGLMDWLLVEGLTRRIAKAGGEDVMNLEGDVDCPLPRPPDSVGKTRVDLGNCNDRGLSGRSNDSRGPPLSPNPLLAAPLLCGGRGREPNSRGVDDVRLSRVCDVDPSRKLEDFRGRSRLSPTTAADNHYRRRKFAAERQQLPSVLNPKVTARGIVRAATAAAAPRSVETFAISPYMEEEESEFCLDDFTGIPRQVDNFVIHAGNKLVSVTALPVYIAGVLTGGARPAEIVYLVGTVGADRVMFKQRVEMWRLVLDPPRKPQYLLKTKKGKWVRLLTEHEDYSKWMSDVRALGHFLNFVKQLPNASPKAAEQDLRKMCRMHNSKPPLDRLSRYIKVIRSFIREDTEFARASILRKIFPNLFSERSCPQSDEEFELGDRRNSAGVKRKAGRLPLRSESAHGNEKRYKVMAKKHTDKPKMVKLSMAVKAPKTLKVGSTPELQSEGDSDYELQKLKASRVVKRRAIDRESLPLHWDDDSDTDFQPQNEPQMGVKKTGVQKRIFSLAEVNVEDPPVCIICDDGGKLLYCDGPCHRHFHPTKGSGSDSYCATLGMTEAEVEGVDKYYCPNCRHNQQQCFICGELGSTVATSDGPEEVRCCDIPFCKRFFHADCAAEVLCASTLDRRAFADAIIDGDQKLYCPRHCCSVCGEAEMEEPGKLVQCRRCPKAWHRSCLTDFSRSMQKPAVRIWEQHDREFIYCRDHKILPKLQTPARDHLRFPASN